MAQANLSAAFRETLQVVEDRVQEHTQDNGAGWCLVFWANRQATYVSNAGTPEILDVVTPLVHAWREPDVTWGAPPPVLHYNDGARAAVADKEKRLVGVGMVLAASQVMDGHGDETVAGEILTAAGLTTREAIAALGIEDYDLNILAPVLAALGSDKSRGGAEDV